MWYTVWYALGIFTGIYIASIHFRLNINKSFNRFIAWVRDVIERNKKIRQQQAEIKRLHGIADTVSFTKRIG